MCAGKVCTGCSESSICLVRIHRFLRCASFDCERTRAASWHARARFQPVGERCRAASLACSRSIAACLRAKIALHLGVFAFDKWACLREISRCILAISFAVALCTGYESVSPFGSMLVSIRLSSSPPFVIVSSPGLYYGAYGEGVSACAFVVGKFICASQWS